jgi:hypothetical protein
MSLQVKIFGEKSPIIDVEHICLFNSGTISKAVEKTGFKTLKTFPVKKIIQWNIGSHIPLPFKKQLNSFFRISGLGKIRISLSLGK